MTNDYRAATWAAASLTILVLAAVSVLPASAAVLAVAASFTGLSFLHACMNPRTETLEIVIAQPTPVATNPLGALFAQVFGDADVSNRRTGNSDDGCPDCHPDCPCRS